MVCSLVFYYPDDDSSSSESSNGEELIPTPPKKTNGSLKASCTLSLTVKLVTSLNLFILITMAMISFIVLILS